MFFLYVDLFCIICYDFYGDIMNNKVLENMSIKNNYLSKYACKDSDAIYITDENKDFRGTFYHDIDKIIYSLSFVRYMDKTQVFSYKNHSHLTKRMLHVQLVSKIARTIGRALGLNEDLIEAIALGHDLGHVPFGHAGEKMLDEISMKHNLGHFNHNVHSVRLLKEIENYGNGVNVSVQVLDGILCHNGEFAVSCLEPKNKTIDAFLSEYCETYTNPALMQNYVAMTLEGCVVRIGDMIAYLGRDIEDGVRLGLVKKEDIPSDIKETLGINNSSIVNTIVNDLIKNSFDKPFIKLSNCVHDAIVKLKKFNYEKIYNNANTEEMLGYYKTMLNTMYDKYLKDLEENNYDSIIYQSYLNNLSDRYKNENSNERIVLDYIAGMTDDYLKLQYESLNVI